MNFSQKNKKCAVVFFAERLFSTFYGTAVVVMFN